MRPDCKAAGRKKPEAYSLEYVCRIFQGRERRRWFADRSAAVERPMSDRFTSVHPLEDFARMPLKTPGYRRALMLGTALLLVWSTWSALLAAEDAGVIAQSADYFPIRSGTNGTIVARLLKGLCKRLSINFSPTCLSVTGTKDIKGMTVTVFHDTNPGNHGSIG